MIENLKKENIMEEIEKPCNEEFIKTQNSLQNKKNLNVEIKKNKIKEIAKKLFEKTKKGNIKAINAISIGVKLAYKKLKGQIFKK